LPIEARTKSGRVRQPDRVGGLLPERRDLTAVGRGLDDAELGGCVIGTRIPATVTTRAGREVLVDHLPRVHAVDVVGTEPQIVSGRSS